MNKNRIPPIKFKIFLDHWSNTELKEVKDVRDGTHSSPKYIDNGYPLVTSKNLTDSGLNLNDVSLISESDYNEINKRSKVEVGDILLGLIGTIGKPVLVEIDGFAIKNVGLIKNGGKIQNQFLLQYLKTNLFNKYIQIEMAGNTQKFLGLETLRNTKVPVPSPEEQSAIGSLFRTLDDLLASYKDNLANYQFLKATMLSKMLPKAGQTVPEIRLEGFEGEWENIRLGDCAIIKGRLGWKSLKQEEYTEVGPSMIAGKHIKNGVIDWGEVDHIPQWRYDESPDIMLEEGDIIFSKDGSLGNPALVSNLKGEATINSTMMLVRLDKEVSSQFFYHILTSSVFQKLIYLKVSGSSIPHLFQADMQDFNFYAPSIEEQQAIGAYFSNLDNLISSHQEKISQLETLKKKLLQDMFI